MRSSWQWVFLTMIVINWTTYLVHGFFLIDQMIWIFQTVTDLHRYGRQKRVLKQHLQWKLTKCQQSKNIWLFNRFRIKYFSMAFRSFVIQNIFDDKFFKVLRYNWTKHNYILKQYLCESTLHLKDCQTLLRYL